MPAAYRNMLDPYVSLMAAAAATTTLKLGTGIALLMERDIFSQAKTIASLDQLSGGRVLIGTGVGWNEEEYSNINPHPFNKRYGVLRETVAATRALWSEGEAEYHGEYIDFDPVWADPKPAQVGGPPIYMGAMGPLGIKHAAEWADGWYPVDIALLDVAQDVTNFKKLVVEAGRDPASVAINIQIMDTTDLDKLKGYRDLGIERASRAVSSIVHVLSGRLLTTSCVRCSIDGFSVPPETVITASVSSLVLPSASPLTSKPTVGSPVKITWKL